MITIKCTSKDTLTLKDLVPLQGTLKHRSDTDRDMLAKSLRDDGLLTPLFVWVNNSANYILDGHHRHQVMLNIEGPNFIVPVVYIKAQDLDEAKQMLLQMDVKYGNITPKGLAQFISETKVVVPSKLNVKLKPGHTTTKVSTPKKVQTHAIIRLRIPIEKVSAFISTLEAVNYVEVL